jgi:60 kDa SS-A/Ro ribonucleoprotein
MGSPITGHRAGSTTKTRCVDVAGLVAASVSRSNDDTRVIFFDTSAHWYEPKASATIAQVANDIARRGGGGTNCESALQLILNDRGYVPDLVIMVSDNESWMGYQSYHRSTGMNQCWKQILQRNKNSQLVLIDLTPNTTTQVGTNTDNVLNVGGFGDDVWSVVSGFVQGNGSFMSEIDNFEI